MSVADFVPIQYSCLDISRSRYLIKTLLVVLAEKYRDSSSGENECTEITAIDHTC